ncbi:MAG: flagellar biosynthesis protein FlhB [Phycisphaerales bacterium]|nr:flagellar biosynthesis protein FlhB [Phycisphaerales bacterium]
MFSDHEDKTEAPTPRRRQQARAQGQIPRSADLTATAALLSGLLFLGWWGPKLWPRLIALLATALSAERLSDDEAPVIFAAAMSVEAGKLVWPIFAVVCSVVLVVVWAQVGWNFTLKPLTPNPGKLNPINGLKRLVSGASAVSLLTNFAKLVVVGITAYVTIAARIDEILLACVLGFENLVGAGAAVIYQLGVRLGVVLLILGLADYVYQRLRHEKQLRMTKQEVKDEMKAMDGDPVVKQRRRRIQMELMRQRLRRTVPQADMVITNPTHLAIALKYDADTMPAPRVLAKGADEVALLIREIASRCGIPVIERKSLARVMYAQVEVGQYIPEKFYQAVAEILAYVYRITGRTGRAARRAG